MLMPGGKTSVRKRDGRWWVTYYLPYSGMLSIDFRSWRRAMREVRKIEKYKEFM